MRVSSPNYRPSLFKHSFKTEKCMASTGDGLRSADRVNIQLLCFPTILVARNILVPRKKRATTHADLLLRCTKKGIKYRVIHNVSILNAIGSIGINLYHFGQTVSIPFFNANWRPQSWFKKINQNFSIGLHTLCLLDIKVKEQSDENLARGRKIYEKPRYMTITTAIEQILSIMEELKQADESLTGEEEEEQTEEKYINRLTDPDQILCIAACRVTSKTEKFLVGTMSELAKLEPEQFGGPLHSLIILGDGPSRKNLNPADRKSVV